MPNQSGQRKHPRSPDKQAANSAVKRPKPNSETNVSPEVVIAHDDSMDMGSLPAPVRVDTASNGASGAKQSLLRSGLSVDDLDSPC